MVLAFLRRLASRAWVRYWRRSRISRCWHSSGRLCVLLPWWCAAN